MDFFDQQHRARRVSVVLLLLFFVVSTVFIAIFAMLGGMFGGTAGSAVGSVVVLLIILFGSLSEWRRLSEGGGHAVAKRVGAKRLYVNKSSDALNQAVEDEATGTASQPELRLSRDEKKLLSAVENMSIASGMRMPATFVMPHEKGINAFVAGFKEHDTVLVATQGAIEQLNENELYGLVGHEFSHIAHGDTRINLRLLIMIGGLQMLHEIASNLLDDDDDRGWSMSLLSSGSRNNGSALLIGWAFLVVSSIGVFCARLIKYAVSRQREFLADAASVQYTRSYGVLDTLVKIRNLPAHGGIQHPSAESISHFFFANAASGHMFSRLLSTHPPIDKRIQRLNPSMHKRLQVQDDIRGKAQAKRRQAEKEALPKLREQQQYRQPSDYDGQPVEFVTSGFAEGTGVSTAPSSSPNASPVSSMPSAPDVAPVAKIGRSGALHADALQSKTPSSEVLQSATLGSDVTSVATNSNQTAPTIDRAVAPALPIRDRELAQHYEQPTQSYVPPFTIAQAIEDSPRGCLAVVAAALACHQQTQIEPEDYEVSRLLFDAIKADARQHDIPLIRLALDSLDTVKLPPKAISLYIQRLHRIITIDNHVSVLEQLLLDQISHQFGVLHNVIPNLQQADVADAFSQVVDAVLVADGHEEDAIVSIKQRMLRLAGLQAAPEDTAFHQAVNLGQSLSMLALQPEPIKKILTETLETTMLANGELSLDEQHTLELLAWRLHVDL